jgi:putative transposase
MAWLEVVYHAKVHSETGQAPLERYRQDETPSTRPVDPTELRQAFAHRDQRKVTKTATFSFKSNRYRAADYLRGRTIELRYDPFDLSHIEIWFDGTFLQVAELDRLVTTVHPDVESDPVPLVPPDEGLDYLAMLRTERERLLRENLQGIQFNQFTLSSTASTKPDEEEEPNDDHR